MIESKVENDYRKAIELAGMKNTKGLGINKRIMYSGLWQNILNSIVSEDTGSVPEHVLEAVIEDSNLVKGFIRMQKEGLTLLRKSYNSSNENEKMALAQFNCGAASGTRYLFENDFRYQTLDNLKTMHKYSMKAGKLLFEVNEKSASRENYSQAAEIALEALDYISEFGFEEKKGVWVDRLSKSLNNPNWKPNDFKKFSRAIKEYVSEHYDVNVN